MKKKYTTEQFIEQCKLKHGNRYNYSKLIYVGIKDRIEIICPIHGAFWQIANDHTNGFGCRRCGAEAVRQFQKSTLDEFIAKATKIHNNFFQYQKAVYINDKIALTITCPAHGDYKQKPKAHLQGKGCIKCSYEKRSINTAEFITRAAKIHNNFYDYSCTQYQNARTKLEIKCPFHGVFQQKASYHLVGNGCPRCCSSRGEQAVEKILIEKNVEYKSEYSFPDCKSKKKLRFDFALFQNSKLLGLIEFQGIQHFQNIKHFGGEEGLSRRKKRDSIKQKYCDKLQIPLLVLDNITNVGCLLNRFLENIIKPKCININNESA